MSLAKDTIDQAPRKVLDRAELERLIAVYRPYLRMIAERSLPAQLLARLDQSDLVQETLLRGWLIQILQHQLVSLVRYNFAAKCNLHRESPAPESLVAIDSTPSECVLQSETRVQINGLLNHLSRTERQIVLWRSEGFSFVEIATRTDSTPDAARMIWARAVHCLSRTRDLGFND